MSAYLASLCDSAGAMRMVERKVIDLLERPLAVIISPTGRKVWVQLQIAPREFPHGLPHADLPKVRAFLEKRLPHVRNSG